MKPPAPPSAASTPAVVRQPAQATKPSLSAEAGTMSQYMAGTEIYLGTFWSAEQMQATPGLRDPVTATSSTFRVAIVSSESCIRESSAATWSSCQKRSITKSQLIFKEMTSSRSSLLNFTFSYRVGHSWSLQCESTASPPTSSLRSPGWMLPAISASFLDLLFWRRLRPVHKLLPVVDAIRERALCQGIRLREWQRRDSIGAGYEGQGTLNYTTNPCAVQD